jgi:hypothetical protein
LKRDIAKFRDVAGAAGVQHFIGKSKNKHSMIYTLNCALSYTSNSFCQDQKIVHLDASKTYELVSVSVETNEKPVLVLN